MMTMEKKIDFYLERSEINLLQLLKATGISETGGQSKDLVDDGSVTLNGLKEFRRRAKLHPGDVVEVMGFHITIQPQQD